VAPVAAQIHHLACAARTGPRAPSRGTGFCAIMCDVPDLAPREGLDVRVAVVDDNPEFRGVADEVIAATRGFIAAHALPSGEDALRTLPQAPADLVLMDVRMPGIGGVAAARALALLSRPPCVVLKSADEDPQIEADPPAHGAIAFVRKHAFCPRTLRQVWAREHDA
jgi:CheY-like chemotaxis protein